MNTVTVQDISPIKLPTLEELEQNSPLEEPQAVESPLESETPRELPPGWDGKDALSTHPKKAVEQPQKEAEQLAAISAAETEQTKSWLQRMSNYFRSFFSSSNAQVEGVTKSSPRTNVQSSHRDLDPAIDEVEQAKTRELSDDQKRDLQRMHEKLERLLQRVQQDCPDVPLDQLMELLFYEEQESKEEEFKAHKVNLERAYKALQENRQEYQKLTEELMKEIKKASWFKLGEDFMVAVSSCVAATTLGPGWVVPAICFSLGKMANSMAGNVLEHATANLAAKTGIITEGSAYIVIQNGFNVILLAGSFALTANMAEGMRKSIQQTIQSLRGLTVSSSSMANYTTENRKADVEQASAYMGLGQKGVDTAVREATEGRKRSDHNAQIIAEWAKRLGDQIKMMMS